MLLKIRKFNLSRAKVLRDSNKSKAEGADSQRKSIWLFLHLMLLRTARQNLGKIATNAHHFRDL